MSSRITQRTPRQIESESAAEEMCTNAIQLHGAKVFFCTDKCSDRQNSHDQNGRQRVRVSFLNENEILKFKQLAFIMTELTRNLDSTTALYNPSYPPPRNSTTNFHIRRCKNYAQRHPRIWR